MVDDDRREYDHRYDVDEMDSDDRPDVPVLLVLVIKLKKGGRGARHLVQFRVEAWRDRRPPQDLRSPLMAQMSPDDFWWYLGLLH